MLDFSLCVWYYSIRRRETRRPTEYGRLAQLVEHLLDVQEVTGSSPVPSTKEKDLEALLQGLFLWC